MTWRLALLACIAAAAIAAGGDAWWALDVRAPIAQATGGEPLPLPPLPPRIASGSDYDHCLDMVDRDPSGASTFAEAWIATGGGAGAEHCRALAQIALGNPAAGAARMERLAGSGQGPAGARASIYGQAGQAWLMAGHPGRAFAAETSALALSADNPDLLLTHAIAASDLDRYQQAADDSTRALATDPRRVEALVIRAAAWRHLGRLDQAEHDIIRAFTLDRGNPEAHLERGILRQRRGDLDGARRDWDAAIALSPDTATADLAQQNLALLDVGPKLP